MDRFVELTRANLLSLFAILTEIVLRPAAVADAVTGTRSEVERTAGLFVAGLALASLQIVFALRGETDVLIILVPSLVAGVFVVILTSAVHLGFFRLSGVAKPFTAILAVVFALHGAELVLTALGNGIAMGVVRARWPASLHEMAKLYLGCPVLSEAGDGQRMLIDLPRGVWIAYFAPLLTSVAVGLVLQIGTYVGFARHRGVRLLPFALACAGALIVSEVAGAGIGFLLHVGFSPTPAECG